eukprot:TRINITY_DN63106_c0_g1_i1.p1 TRINITY_DN63106_c0_g1~~TRINITY_DN63106_c0_g1_i1.p1  ORF type:complete len:190 (-),score=37.34 TRINITY_DN63106_c0_g1_i1:91-660(-)
MYGNNQYGANKQQIHAAVARANFQNQKNLLDADISAGGHGPWTHRQTRNDEVREFVMRQDPMKIRMECKGEVTDDRSLKLWIEERAKDSWNPLVNFTIPVVFMRCSGSAEVGELQKEIQQLVQSDLQGQCAGITNAKISLTNFTVQGIVCEGDPAAASTKVASLGNSFKVDCVCEVTQVAPGAKCCAIS